MRHGRAPRRHGVAGRGQKGTARRPFQEQVEAERGGPRPGVRGQALGGVEASDCGCSLAGGTDRTGAGAAGAVLAPMSGVVVVVDGVEGDNDEDVAGLIVEYGTGASGRVVLAFIPLSAADVTSARALGEGVAWRAGADL